MYSYKTKNNRKYKPIKINESLSNVNRKILNKFNGLDYIIFSKWPNIVGSFFNQYSEPEKITSIPTTEDSKGNIVFERFLHVNVSPAAAIEFQHLQTKIIEKINSLFGFKAIYGIKIRQKYIENKGKISTSKSLKTSPNNNEKKRIKVQTSAINDKKLKESLVKLGLNLSIKK